MTGYAQVRYQLAPLLDWRFPIEIQVVRDEDKERNKTKGERERETEEYVRPG